MTVRVPMKVVILGAGSTIGTFGTSLGVEGFVSRLREVCGSDFTRAGQMLSEHSRRYGRVRPRDHSHDLLIAIGGRSLAVATPASNERHNGVGNATPVRLVAVGAPAAVATGSTS
jgi:hypothetical protein